MMSFRLLSNQQCATAFGIIVNGKKGMKIIVIVEGSLSVWCSHGEGGIWSVLENRVLRKIFGP
jgi:hypothetical protein